MSLLKIYLPDNNLDDACEWQWSDAARAGATQRGNQLSALTALLNAAPADEVIAIAPASRVLLARVTLPPVGANKLRELLPFAVEDKLLCEPDSIHIVAANRAADGDTAVAVIEKAWLTQAVLRLGRAGIKPDKLVADISLLPREDHAWSVLLQKSGSFVRTGIHDGQSLDEGAAPTPPLALALALDEARAAGSLPQRILLYHAPQTDLPDHAAWQQVLGVPVEVRGAWSWCSGDAPIGDTAPNFLQGEFAPARKSNAWLPRLKPALAVAASIVAVHFLASVIDWARLSIEQTTLRDEMTQTFKATFPEARAVVDPLLQMRRNLGALRRNHGAADAGDLLPLLAATSHETGGMAIKVRSLHYEQDKLQLNLSLADAAQAEAARARFTRLSGQSDKAAIKAEVGAISPRADWVELGVTVQANPGGVTR